MKFLRKVLVLVLVIGIVGGIWGINQFKVQSEKLKVEKTENEKTEQPLKFVVMSDIHSDWENFRKALEKASEGFGGDEGFVVLVGDLTTIGKKGELSEAKKILDGSGLKYYVIPGNHDIWWGRKFKENLWEEVFGESFLSFKKNGVKFILVNNGDDTGGLEGPSFAKASAGRQELWIKKETEECLRVYCLVFMHMPLNHPNSLHVMGEESPEVASEAAQLIKLLVDNNVQEIFAGHLHFSSSYELGGLRTTIVGAVGADRNFQSPKFLEVVMENGNIEKRDVFLEE